VARQSIGALDGASGDVKNQGAVRKGQKQNKAHGGTGTNLVKDAVMGQTTVDAITWAPIKD